MASILDIPFLTTFIDNSEEWFGDNIEPYFEHNLDHHFEGFAAAVGQDLVSAKYLLCILLTIPLAFIFRMLPYNKNIRNLFSMSVGMFLCFFTFKSQIVFSFLSALVVYIILLTFPRKIAGNVVFLFTMGFMCSCHIYRQYTDYLNWTLDFTGPQMMLTVKLTSFGFNYADGLRYKTKKGSEKPSDPLVIVDLPSLLEFFGFVYFFPAFMAGPAHEYQDYANLTTGALFVDCPGGVAPSTFVPTLKAFITGALAAIVLQLSPMFPMEALWDPTSDYATKHNIFLRSIILWISTVVTRFRYYFGWFLAEAACNQTGFGFSGYKQINIDGKSERIAVWDRATNARILPLEFASSMKSVTGEWNIKVSAWLRRYIYDRVARAGGGKSGKDSSLALFSTYFTSAIWHGFYPGYFMMFISGAIYTTASRILRKTLRPFFLKPQSTGRPVENYPIKYLYDLCGTIVTSQAMTYIGASFLALDMGYGLVVWSSMYYIWHILSISIILLEKVGIARMIRRLHPQPIKKIK